jgi:ribosomal protein L3 glutamine methyltransferase
LPRKQDSRHGIFPEPENLHAAASDDFVTLRDMLRHAVSRFRAADLVFAHGATTALDEAAFIVLEALHLPVDSLEPWLDARLTARERGHLLELIGQRVATRKPAAYLLGRTYIQGMPVRVDERVIVPRSYLAEIMAGGRLGDEGFGLIDNPGAVTSVLDLCTGSGCLALIAARVFPEARIDAVDLSADALDVARLNVAEHGLTDRITLFEGDLFAPLGGRRYDLILTNPPYVDGEAMASLPPEFRHEPAMALAGGRDGLDIVHRILAVAARHLAPGGGLLCEVGEGRAGLEAAHPQLPFLWLDTEDSEAEVFWLARSDLADAAPRRRGAAARG